MANHTNRGYDLTNQRFGKLIALYKCDYKKGNKYPWHCVCDCGNEVDIRTSDLTQGKIKSCGCLRKEVFSNIGKTTIKNIQGLNIKDLTDQRFGRLVAIKIVSHNPVKWECKCDCGNTVIIQSKDLISGNTSSCGCLRSKGQEKIANILNENNISYISEKVLNCYYPNGGQARFDFYVENSYVIEYDGIQHFKENNFFNLTLKEQQERDTFKNNWCAEHEIPIIRIPYFQLNNIKLNDLKPETSQFLINKNN